MKAINIKLLVLLAVLQLTIGGRLGEPQVVGNIEYSHFESRAHLLLAEYICLSIAQ